jgi:hypothetical protein
VRLARESVLTVACISISCGFGFQCEDELLVESRSPKGPQSVRVLLRNCGATTEYVTIAQALEPGLFGRWRDIARIQGRPVVEIRWSSVKSASVRYARCAPGRLIPVSSGVKGLAVDVVDLPELSSQCGSSGYWEPSARASGQ